MIRIALLVLCLGAVTARADGLTPADCVDIDTTPGALLEPPPSAGEVGTPIPWSEFEVQGRLVDPAGTLHALLAPTLAQHRTDLTPRTMVEIAKIVAKLGYQLAGHDVQGARLVLRLEPLPMVRKVVVDVEQSVSIQSLFSRLIDDEIRRRMLVRVGSYLPADAKRRECAIVEERARIEDYLHDEGYFESDVKIAPPTLDHNAATVVVRVKLGPEYKLAPGNPTIIKPAGFNAVNDDEIRKQFQHTKVCVVVTCFGTTQFTRTQQQEDLQKVRDLFHRREYPAVRVVSSFDPKTSFDRNTKTVRMTLTIDPRRRLQIRFEGVDHDMDEQLGQRLTFDREGSTDDVEAASSARELETYMQKRGKFDVRVTWKRDRLDEYDRVTFYIDQGPTRLVSGVQFVCNRKSCDSQRDRPKRQPFDSGALSDLVATKLENFTGDLLGTNVSATSPELAADIDRIREAYRRAGYRETSVSVAAGPIPMPPPEQPPPSAALTASLVERNDGEDLYVRFTIEEGEPTLLARIELEPADDGAKQALAGGLCEQLLRELSSELATTITPDPAKQLATRADKQRCVAVAARLPFREDDVALARDRVRDFLFKKGRPRAEIEYEARVLGPHLVEAHFRLHTIDERRIGKVVVRGNFRTHTSVIEDRLDLHEGDLMTSDALAEAARRLRNTGLFDAVNIELVDKDSGASEINTVVRIQERYDNFAQLELQLGRSSYNGNFGTVIGGPRNLWGTGTSLTGQFTYGDRITDVEGKLVVPKWITHLGGQADLTGQYLDQDTPRFGRLTTEAVTTGLTWFWPRTRIANVQDARTVSIGAHYDYRLRTRNIDALRPIGADMDDTQVAVSTQTGSIGATIDIDQRVDRNGQLAPLAPEKGYHLFGQLAYAFPELAPLLGGQASFIKASASGSYFVLVGKNLVIRGDLRYDQGFPLGGSALLPEVERFFAGGDNTVRGFADDRLATEIIQVGVPPLSNISQIRVIPAGGDIRVLSSIDAQYHIWWIMAGAVFTDAGMIANDWRLVTASDVRPSAGMGLRFLSPFGIAAIEYAVPLAAHLGDDPRGRYHLYFAARAQF